MLVAIAVTMIVLWLLAMLTSWSMTGMMLTLPLIAIVAIVLRLMRRQNVWVTTKPHSMERKSLVRRHGQSLRPAREKAVGERWIGRSY
jgi:hypothetical protein